MALDDVIPPFAALRAFQAAAREGSFRNAARALNVSESAVSHQIRKLENLVHVQLFERHGTSTELTPAGRDYYAEIDPALAAIGAATRKLNAPRGRHRVAITLPPSLAINWLIPRVAAFEAANADIDLELVATTRLIDLRREQVDLAIRHGAGPWDDVTSEFLLEEIAMPVMRPGLVDVENATPAEILASQRLIVGNAFPDEWNEWARARGETLPDLSGALHFETTDQVLAAAERGLGLAIGRSPVVDDHLQTGRLVAPFGDSYDSGTGYYLCQPRDMTPTAAIRRVTAWLMDSAQASHSAENR